MNSINKLARAAGFPYPILIFAGGFAEAFVREGLTAYKDVNVTAQNILASEQMNYCMYVIFPVRTLTVLTNWKDQDRDLYHLYED